MSLVLDALKRADHEKHNIEVEENDDKIIDYLKFEQKHQSKKNQNTKSYLFVLALMLLIFILGSMYKEYMREFNLNDENLNIKISSSTPIDFQLSDTDGLVLQSNQRGFNIIKPQSVSDLNYNITGHIFLGKNNSANKIFVDGQAYGIGELLPRNYKVVRVSTNEMIIEKEGVEIIVFY